MAKYKCEECGASEQERRKREPSPLVWHSGGLILPGSYCSRQCWERALRKAQQGVKA